MTASEPHPGRAGRLAGVSRRAAGLARSELVEEATEASLTGLRSRRERQIRGAEPLAVG